MARGNDNQPGTESGAVVGSISDLVRNEIGPAVLCRRGNRCSSAGAVGPAHAPAAARSRLRRRRMADGVGRRLIRRSWLVSGADAPRRVKRAEARGLAPAPAPSPACPADPRSLAQA